MRLPPDRTRRSASPRPGSTSPTICRSCGGTGRWSRWPSCCARSRRRSTTHHPQAVPRRDHAADRAPQLTSLTGDQNPWLENYWNMEYYPTQYRLLQSRGLAERVVLDLRLMEDPEFNPGSRAGGSASADGDRAALGAPRRPAPRRNPAQRRPSSSPTSPGSPGGRRTTIVSVGDYNAFQVNDGYVDVMGTVRACRRRPTEVVLASPPLLNPVLTTSSTCCRRTALLVFVRRQRPDAGPCRRERVAHEAVQPLTLRAQRRGLPGELPQRPDRPERLSDHDMPVAYFAFPGARLTLNGPNPMQVECCTAFVDPGASASDEDLGD